MQLASFVIVQVHMFEYRMSTINERVYDSLPLFIYARSVKFPGMPDSSSSTHSSFLILAL